MADDDDEESYLEFERSLFNTINENRVKRRRQHIRIVVSNPEVISTPTPPGLLSLAKE